LVVAVFLTLIFHKAV